MVARTPRPDFSARLSQSDVNIHRGGTALVNVDLERRDGFDGAVTLEVRGLPEGVHAAATPIEAGSEAATIAFSADDDAPRYAQAGWHVIARAKLDPRATLAVKEVERVVWPGGPTAGLITLTREPNLEVAATPTAVSIRPGGEARVSLRVTRRHGFAGRVPLEVLNLPRGVRVLDVGLNGVLVPEGQTERVVVLRAEPWTAAGTRAFYASARAESVGTNDASRPILLTVEPKPAAAPTPAATTANAGVR